MKMPDHTTFDVVLPHEQGPVAVGEPVEVWLFDGLA